MVETVLAALIGVMLTGSAFGAGLVIAHKCPEVLIGLVLLVVLATVGFPIGAAIMGM